MNEMDVWERTFGFAGAKNSQKQSDEASVLAWSDFSSLCSLVFNAHIVTILQNWSTSIFLVDTLDSDR